MYRLLVADSDAMEQESIFAMLDWSAYGFDNILHAGSYAEAVDLALDQHPQVIFVDSELEGGKGSTLVEQLRKAGSTAVFCLMSRRETMAELRRAMRCGARECLHKPIQEDALRGFVEWALTEELGGILPVESFSPFKRDPVLQREYSEFSRITNKILLLIHSEYASSLSLTAIAEQFNMSNKYIGRIFLRDTGMRFTEYLMAYLMLQARKNGSSSFTIPFDRQELADYLEVDRSGLSAEISKLRSEGILESERNAGALFGADTFYSTEGSSLCVRAMLHLIAKKSGKRGEKTLILAGRNAHKAFLSATAYTLWAVLLGHNPVSSVTVYSFLQPIFGVMLSLVLVAGDGPVPLARYAAALVLVSAGILVVVRGQRKAA